MNHPILSKMHTTPQIIASIAATLRGKRVAMGLTQSELASRANVTQLTIHNLEAGRSVRLDTLIDVARVLDMAHRLTEAFTPSENEFSSIKELEVARGTPKRVRVSS